MRSRSVLCLLLVVWFVIMVLGACGAAGATTAPAAPSTTPEAPGSAEVLLQERCDTSCHSLQRVTSAHKTAEEWERTVRRMVGKGAQLDDAEVAALVAYLAATYK